jgi:hypothetical protein
MNRARTPLLSCIGLALASPLFAAAPAPADPSVPVPAAGYPSAFESYRGYREEPLADWRAVNDEVGVIGGHAGIFRAPAAAQGQPPARGAPQAPAAAGHGH